jgi:hypothetical protein
MYNGEFKLSQLRLGWIYPIKEGDMILEPDAAHINLIGRICSTGVAAMILEPDGGQIIWLVRYIHPRVGYV